MDHRSLKALVADLSMVTVQGAHRQMLQGQSNSRNGLRSKMQTFVSRRYIKD
jgi:hypothetical protein